MLLRYPALYRQAGKAILTTDFVEDTADKALDKAMKSLIDNENVIKQLNTEINELEGNKSGLRQELVSLDVKGKPNKKVQELEAEIVQINTMIHDNFVSMGDLFLKQNLIKKTGNDQITEYMRIISDLEQANDRCEAEIKRYETLIAIEKIDFKISRTTDKIDHIKSQMEKYDQEIKALQKELAQFSKQKKAFEKMLEKTPDQGNAAPPGKKESAKSG
jgi:chromosome segregation ATPase